MEKFFQKVQQFLKVEAVLCISAAAALITMVFVPPSANYISYLDFRVLGLLFSLMAVVAGLMETGIFMILSDGLLKKVVGIRSLSLVLIMLCFFTSMFITNDVALITFVPFAIMVLSMADQEKYIIRIVVLQTIAANLGSMLTPVGNPQNLYLYSYFHISIKEFLQITFPYTAVSFVLLCISILFIKKEPLSFAVPKDSIDKKSSHLITMYSILFLVCLSCVLRLLDYRITLLIILVFVLLFDRKTLKKVDYSLLLTFVCFFIFVGNIANISIIKDTLVKLLAARTLPVSIVVSQFISNVPAAVLLSAFTNDHKALILGTDIGGLGTLVASLASLISFKFYCKINNANHGRYLGVFTLYNVLFLAGLCLFYQFRRYVIWLLLFLLLV